MVLRVVVGGLAVAGTLVLSPVTSAAGTGGGAGPHSSAPSFACDVSQCGGQPDSTSGTGLRDFLYSINPPVNEDMVDGGPTLAAAVASVDAARAKEGIATLVLPSNWESLTKPEQQFVLVNLERTARGEQALVGMNADLNAAAECGAILSVDPCGTVVQKDWGSKYGNDWMTLGYEASVDPEVIYGLFAMLYSDSCVPPFSFGGRNADCQSASNSDPASWGHRDEILAHNQFGTPDAEGTGCPDPPIEGSYCTGYFGAADFGGSIAAVVIVGNFGWVQIERATHPLPPITFTWASELAYLPACEKATGAVGWDGNPIPADTCTTLPPCPPGDVYFCVEPPPPPTCNPAGAPVGPVVGIADDAATGGYWMVTALGQVLSCDAPFMGSPAHLSGLIVGIASTPSGNGYYLVGADGSVFAYGSAVNHGQMAGTPLNKPVVGMAVDPATGGYWLVASDGGIFSFGAPFHGSMGGKTLNKPVVGIAEDPATGGYWLVASDGGIFAFGAPFEGSMGGSPLNEPVVGMTVAESGSGYRMVASDGGIFSFGAPFHGSMGGRALAKPVVSMAPDVATGGYWEVGSDGGIFSFGAPFEGAAG